MHLTVFSAYAYEQPYLTRAAQGQHELRFVPAPLGPDTVAQAQGSQAVAIFANDDASAPVLERLAALGVRGVAVRAAGHDQVDLAAAQRLGLRVANAPDYSPYAVAEHAVTLMLALNRRLRLADQQLRAYDFRLGNLVGFDMHGKTVGIIGCGRIGGVVARILHGFGCRLLGYDIKTNDELRQRYELTYVPLEQVCAEADIISIHAPLNEHTRHLIDADLLAKMKPGAMLINTGRGAVIDTEAALAALQSGRLGYLGIDVYEHEKGLYFNDHTLSPRPDQLFAALLAHPNALVTGHQAFLTREALSNIADATMASVTKWEHNEPSTCELV
ncbi:hydroxyacid dehydrogenase [Hymenobacter sedentarius]|uniref:Hydroxyacid dehydrogenase n=1 Tax=Hymenobacter sedentarius TaxID=1411621 RepID=A0A0U3T1G8_9BACT|nr:2-hydroxyacid dehydrogenase [Hymenobacter sedentarius]ALW86739.1 hydroxyacid dehydrogenase [Hymenobacter sedentarius]